MALTQQKIIDSIETVTNGCLNVRQASQIFDGDKMIAESFERWCLAPGDDISTQDPKVQAIATAVWTDEVVSAYKAYVIANAPRLMTAS